MLPLYGSFTPQLQSSSAQPNSVPSQPQLGMNNPQIPIPFNGNNFISNGLNMPNQPGFMNGPNTHHLGMAQLAPIPQHGKPHIGFGPQSGASNMNPAFQVRGQAFGPFNPNVNQFGQFCLPNALPNMSQFGLMQMPNLSQFVPGNVIGVLNQAPQNPGFLGNPQFGNLRFNQIPQQINQNQQNFAMPVVTQQIQGNSSVDVSSSVQTDQTNMNFARNPTRTDGFNDSRGNWKNRSSKIFTKNPNRGTQQGRFQNSRFNHMKNGRKNFGSPNPHNGRGLGNDISAHFGSVNSTNGERKQNQRRRSLSLTYTEHEIRQWREERRKNYPSKGNIEKKLTEKTLNKESLQKEAEKRRERLKEILAKQAELGVEVAEIPRSYLSDSRKQEPEIGENERPFNKKGRFRNKFDKRGRFDNKDRFSKKQRLNEDASSNAPLISKKQPTLLQKLLRADMKRDKSYLLQAFRFMVLNSFLNDSADNALKFPLVTVSDGSGVNDTAEQSVGKYVSEVSDKTLVGEVDCSNDNGDSGSEDDNENEGEFGRIKPEDEEEEEDGEIH